MKERDFQAKLTRWAKHHLFESCAIEAKLTKEARLPFSALLDHQRDALQAASSGSLVYKIPDVGLGQKPFDMFVLRQSRAYVAAMWYLKGCKHFYLIPISEWVQAERDARVEGRASLTEEEAAIIGTRCDLG